jgi:hypothetical protein
LLQIEQHIKHAHQPHLDLDLISLIREHLATFMIVDQCASPVMQYHRFLLSDIREQQS